MAQIDLNWLAANSVRSYPLTESVATTSDDGTRVPDDILVDARIRFPAALGVEARVTGLTVGPNVVSVVLTAYAQDGTATPLGACSVFRPLDIGRPYAITPAATGVGGYLVFGPGAGATDSYRVFRFAAGVPLVPRAAAAYEPLPVSGIGRLESNQRLTGLVRVSGGGDLIVEGADRDLGDGLGSRRVVVFRLDTQRRPDALYEYAGPCAGRPESGTCDFTPIISINSVQPDANGNITLRFAAPFYVETVAGDADTVPGLAVDTPYSMGEACAALAAATRPSPYGSSNGDDTESVPWFEVVSGACYPLEAGWTPLVIPGVGTLNQYNLASDPDLDAVWADVADYSALSIVIDDATVPGGSVAINAEGITLGVGVDPAGKDVRVCGVTFYPDSYA